MKSNFQRATARLFHTPHEPFHRFCWISIWKISPIWILLFPFQVRLINFKEQHWLFCVLDSEVHIYHCRYLYNGFQPMSLWGIDRIYSARDHFQRAITHFSILTRGMGSHKLLQIYYSSGLHVYYETFCKIWTWYVFYSPVVIKIPR
jgi:hypothetical protein